MFLRMCVIPSLIVVVNKEDEYVVSFYMKVFNGSME